MQMTEGSLKHTHSHFRH